jgi:hypothetical protein
MAHQIARGNLKRTAKSPPTPKSLPGAVTDMQGGMSMPPALPTDLGPPSAAAPMGAPQVGGAPPAEMPPPGMGPEPFKPSDLVKKGRSKK